ncbi:hypothetical protein ACRQ5Q_28895 [Bradyrhizobium sp. PMVTL-01]|uniref:hypothetical protein n=1 Tax=unclassified Bradyrhizobium TaxID=2631580 RepID=UPI003F719679
MTEQAAAPLGRNAAGTIVVNGCAASIKGGPATVANTKLIQAFGQDGNGIITIDESNGAMPAANLFGAIRATRFDGYGSPDTLHVVVRRAMLPTDEPEPFEGF